MAGLDEIKAQLAAEIASHKAAIEERRTQIQVLQEQNDEAEGRIEALTRAQTALGLAQDRLEEVGPLVPTAAEPKIAGKRGLPVKQHVLPIVGEAGPAGITVEEIVAKCAERGLTVKVDSVRATLYKYQGDEAGALEKVGKGKESRWRERQRPPLDALAS